MLYGTAGISAAILTSWLFYICHELRYNFVFESIMLLKYETNYIFADSCDRGMNTSLIGCRQL